MDVAGFEHGPWLVFPVLGRQSAFDSLLAATENFGVISFHSKWPFVGCGCVVINSIQPAFMGISSFFVSLAKKSRLLRG
jgi:hypothetical protein